jgi:hypothetical protein
MRTDHRPERLPRHISWADFAGVMRTWALLAVLSGAIEVVLFLVKGPYHAGEFARLFVLFFVPASVALLPAYAGRWRPQRFPGLKTGIAGVLLYAALLVAIT